MAQTGNPFTCASKAVRRRYKACDEPTEHARISNLAYVLKGEILPTDDYATIVTKINTLEAQCKAFVIREITGNYDGGADTTGAAGGRLKEKVTSRVHTVVYQDFEYVGNENFYEALEENQKDYDVFFFTETKVWPVVGPSLKISPKGPIGEDVDAEIPGQITITWQKLGLLKSFTTNIDELKKAAFLAFVALTNEAGSAATVNGETVTVAVNGAVEVKAAFTGATEYSLGEGSALPAGLTITADGIIDGVAPAAAGEHRFRLRAENDCGLAGEIEVTLIVTPV